MITDACTAVRTHAQHDIKRSMCTAPEDPSALTQALTLGHHEPLRLLNSYPHQSIIDLVSALIKDFNLLMEWRPSFTFRSGLHISAFKGRFSAYISCMRYQRFVSHAKKARSGI